MKAKSLLIVGLAVLTSSCAQQQSEDQTNTDQNFQQRRQQMQQKQNGCCDAEQKLKPSNQTVEASEATAQKPL